MLFIGVWALVRSLRSIKMHSVQSSEALQAQCLAWRAEGLRVGLVPTMGFLHAGHLSLMTLARAQCDKLVVSIYVNPLQFDPNEDLDQYPRDQAGDAAKCRAEGVDLLFLPDALYPPGHSTRVIVSGLTERLCGVSRPGHLEGVTTVVSRLFGLVFPHFAVFGEKDYQQLAVLRRMTRDLGLPIEVLGGPLVRDHDGIALSSRNALLNPEQRSRALSLNQALSAMVDLAAAGETDVATILAVGQEILTVDEVHYLEILDAEHFEPLRVLDRPARAFVAGKLGNTRLIDNKALSPVG
jgi:pantoate--beta-alanine ligase